LDELFAELADEVFASDIEVGGLLVLGLNFLDIVGFFEFFNLDVHLCRVCIAEGDWKNWRLILVQNFTIFQLEGLEVNGLNMFSSAEQYWKGVFLGILKVQCRSATTLIHNEGRGRDGHIVRGGIGV
jgi:hypothetical protein